MKNTCGVFLSLLMVFCAGDAYASDIPPSSAQSCDKALTSSLDQKPDSNGMAAVSDQVPLNAANLIAAYRKGLFPWTPPNQQEMRKAGGVGWFAGGEINPEFVLPQFQSEPGFKRGVLEISEMHVGKNMRKVLRKIANGDSDYQITFNYSFERVIEGCRTMKRKNKYGEEEYIWLTKQIADTYVEAYRKGHAYSVEVWDGPIGGKLAGGTYGMYADGSFSAESLFRGEISPGVLYSKTSFIAAYALAARLESMGIKYLDTQVVTEGSATVMGSQGVSFDRYKDIMKSAAKDGRPSSLDSEFTTADQDSIRTALLNFVENHIGK